MRQKLRCDKLSSLHFGMLTDEHGKERDLMWMLEKQCQEMSKPWLGPLAD